MRSKYLLAAAVLLPFVTMPSLANAGQTYGSHKAARMAEQRVPNAYAYYPTWDFYPTWDLKLCSYQGGPKSNTWACSWRAE